MSLLSPLLKKLLNPVEVYRIIKLQRGRKKAERVYDDAQLKLYGQLLPGGFLHYGYFDDPSVQAGDISLNMIYQAQYRYAERLTDKLPSGNGEALDIGCGMGGLLPLIQKKGMMPVALTPDKTQIHHITQKFPDIQRYQCRFEDIPLQENLARFDALITSESLQYLKLDEALPLMHKISKEDAIWVACDYFRTGVKAERSGHQWEEFVRKLEVHGWRIEYEDDITEHILPTIAYVYMWGNNIGRPLMEFGIDKLKLKAPGWYYAAKESIERIKGKLDRNLATVDPVLFGQNKRYKLIVMRKVGY
jgi:cyclopropane fatty-acyl-phospholipid synthase-like methyltransferase